MLKHSSMNNIYTIAALVRRTLIRNGTPRHIATKQVSDALHTAEDYKQACDNLYAL